MGQFHFIGVLSDFLDVTCDFPSCVPCYEDAKDGDNENANNNDKYALQARDNKSIY